MKSVCTTCPYCGVGCGVIATPDGDGGAEINGDPNHPSNFGRLCSKGSALGQTIDLEGRILTPQIAGLRASWDEALDLVARRFRETIAKHGPDSVAFYVSGQFLTEDYYVANKLMKGYIGSANIDTNSRLCMASSVAGHKRAFGTDTVPGTYEDLEEADLIVLVGSNLAWCHPVLHQRIMAAKETRDIKIVNIDPRHTATSETADMHLGINSGSDVMLFNGLLNYIKAIDAIDQPYIEAHVNGADAAFDAAGKADIATVSAVTGLPEQTLQGFYKLWVSTEKSVTIYSQGVNQASDGTDKVNAIINCHLATGRIGKPGMGPFSVTGQPNAMGGREVGGLANMLANHLDLDNAHHRAKVQAFWDAPVMADHAGLKAVEMFEACASGQIKALWIMCSNPAVSLPRADHVVEAIKNCDFVAVSDIMAKTDTTELADVLLPATGWGEKDGTVTNSERRISRQRGFLPKPGKARHDWEIICDVARRMGFSTGFDFANPGEIFTEFAALSQLSKNAGLDFDITGLKHLSMKAYDNLAPAQWPVSATQAGGRFFGDGTYFTADTKANMLALTHRDSVNIVSPDYPLILNTGRIRDHWHTMTRTAKSARLSQHMAEPFVEIHPEDAARLSIRAADIVKLSSPHGTMLARALITKRTPVGLVFTPMHWTGQWAAKGRTDALIAAVTDPISGQPELKRTAVALAPAQMDWHAFAIGRAEPHPNTAYWAKARTIDGWRAELAGDVHVGDWQSFAKSLFNIKQAEAILLEDRTRGGARVALMADGKVQAALFVSRDPVSVSRNYLASALSDIRIAPAHVLAGKPSLGRPDPGATVCACFNVGINTIRTAIANQGLTSVDAIGQALQAGTNCGSCRSELSAILKATDIQHAAE